MGEVASAEEYWDERYGGTERIWSGRPNVALVREVTGLAPGTALDLGCGEGGDAIWLAGQGWRVVGTDVSRRALERAAGHAERAGVADRVEWRRHDLAVDFPAGRFDLVSAHFLHSPVEMPREEILRSAAAAVAPGGVLLVVGHAGWPAGDEPRTSTCTSPPRRRSTRAWSCRPAGGNSWSPPSTSASSPTPRAVPGCAATTR